LTVKDIQSLLSNDGLFASGDKQTYAFAVTRTAVAAKVIPLGASALAEKVAAFRRGLHVEAPQSAEGGKPALFVLAGGGHRPGEARAVSAVAFGHRR
jgi:hypothetical protein